MTPLPPLSNYGFRVKTTYAGLCFNNSYHLHQITPAWMMVGYSTPNQSRCSTPIWGHSKQPRPCSRTEFIIGGVIFTVGQTIQLVFSIADTPHRWFRKYTIMSIVDMVKMLSFTNQNIDNMTVETQEQLNSMHRKMTEVT